MTDARLPGRWLTDPVHDNLSDGAYRVLHNALMFCAEQGTDGMIQRAQLRFVYPGTVDPAWLDELERAGLWQTTPGGYALAGWSTSLGQSTAAEVEAYRAKNRDRQRRHRAKAAGTTTDRKRNEDERQRTVSAPAEPHAPSIPPETPDAARREVVTRDVTRYATRDEYGDVGKARQGSALPPKEPSLELGATSENDDDTFDLEEPRQPRTVNEPRPYPAQCDRHQVGEHTAACRDCKSARLAIERPRTTRSRPPALTTRKLNGRDVCDNRPHQLAADGRSCLNCAIRAEDLQPIGAVA